MYLNVNHMYLPQTVINFIIWIQDKHKINFEISWKPIVTFYNNYINHPNYQEFHVVRKCFFLLFALDYSEAHETWQYEYHTKCQIQEHKNKRNQTGFAAILEQKHYVSCNFLNVLSYCFQMSSIIIFLAFVSHISLFTWKFGKYFMLTAHKSVLLSLWYRICKPFCICSIKQTSSNL